MDNIVTESNINFTNYTLKTAPELSKEHFSQFLKDINIKHLDFDFIQQIIEKNPEQLDYLEIYYKFLDNTDIEIIRNSKNDKGETLVQYYSGLDRTHMDNKIIDHINQLINAGTAINNMMELFNLEFEAPPSEVDTLKAQVDIKLAELDSKFTSIDSKFSGLDEKINKMVDIIVTANAIKPELRETPNSKGTPDSVNTPTSDMPTKIPWYKRLCNCFRNNSKN